MNPLSWILVVTGLVAGAIVLAWLMKMSLNLKDRDR